MLPLAEFIFQTETQEKIKKENNTGNHNEVKDWKQYWKC
jgi:hypothetical protein